MEERITVMVWSADKQKAWQWVDNMELWVNKNGHRLIDSTLEREYIFFGRWRAFVYFERLEPKNPVSNPDPDTKA